MVPQQLTALYREHIAAQWDFYRQLLHKQGYQRLIIAAGDALMQFRDDLDYPFKVNPYFKAWAPLTDNPGCYLVIDTEADKPILFYRQPRDIWHKVTPLQDTAVIDNFDVVVFAELAELVTRLRQEPPGTAYIGSDVKESFGAAAVNPESLLVAIDYRRAYKNTYEQACLRLANARAIPGHRAAAEAFFNGASEYEIHSAYLQATGLLENELPYGNIIALNENAAILHYTQKQPQPPQTHRSFLIDAGATVAGYAADISRTYAQADTRFADLIEAMDQAQQDIVARIQPGRSYVELHRWAHRRLAQVLMDFNLVKGSVDSCVEQGITRVFLPHGLGHLLGLQVHDRGGWLRSSEGDELPPPAEHPFLRLTRTIEVNQVFTIEPGLYFIPALLAEAKADKRASLINWAEVEGLMLWGGIRIEDNILVTDTGIENITREQMASGQL